MTTEEFAWHAWLLSDCNGITQSLSRSCLYRKLFAWTVLKKIKTFRNYISIIKLGSVAFNSLQPIIIRLSISKKFYIDGEKKTIRVVFICSYKKYICYGHVNKKYPLSIRGLISSSTRSCYWVITLYKSYKNRRKKRFEDVKEIVWVSSRQGEVFTFAAFYGFRSLN